MSAFNLGRKPKQDEAPQTKGDTPPKGPGVDPAPESSKQAEASGSAKDMAGREASVSGGERPSADRGAKKPARGGRSKAERERRRRERMMFQIGEAADEAGILDQPEYFWTGAMALIAKQLEASDFAGKTAKVGFEIVRHREDLRQRVAMEVKFPDSAGVDAKALRELGLLPARVRRHVFEGRAHKASVEAIVAPWKGVVVVIEE